jgi:hypothetical protein
MVGSPNGFPRTAVPLPIIVTLPGDMSIPSPLVTQWGNWGARNESGSLYRYLMA